MSEEIELSADEYVVIIPDYLDKIKVSEKRRPTYYKKGDKIPKKYVVSHYISDFAIDENGNKIIKNVRVANKPRYIPINFQKFWVGVHHSVRSNISKKLHEYYADIFKKQLPKKIKIPKDKVIEITFKVYNTLDAVRADLDNHVHLHIKTCLDTLTPNSNPNQKDVIKLGIIPGDELEYVRSINYSFHEVSDIKDKKMEIIIKIINKN